MERYRSGHNGADSKIMLQLVVSSTLKASVCVGSNVLKLNSSLLFFFVRKFHCSGKTQEKQAFRYPEGYRSGHNEPDSKSG